MRRRGGVLRPGLPRAGLTPHPHPPARGLAATAEADSAQQPWTRQAGGSEQDQSSAEEQGELPVAPPCVPCSPLVLHPGVQWGFVCLKGHFPPETFFLAFLHSLLQASGKKMALETGFVLEGSFYLMHLCTSGVLLLV